MGKNTNFIPLESPQIAVVEASAGSGKTYTLAKRFIQLLINKANFPSACLPSVLAVTFTNKAAFEMKERILEILKKIALDCFASEEEKKDILEILEIDYNSARRNAYCLIEEIIRHYNFFGVKTIDSFINSLLLGCALHIKRSANFKIKRNHKDYLLYSLDVLIDRALSDKKLNRNLYQFLKHYLFVENRGSWFPKEKILELIVSLFELANRYGKPFSRYGSNTESLLKQKSLIYVKIEELARACPPDFDKRSKKSLLKFIREGGPQFEIAKLPNCLSKPRPPQKQAVSAGRDYVKLWGQTRRFIRKAVECESETAYNPYIDLFNKLSGVFEEACRKEDVLFLQQLNHQAGFLFGPGGITVAEMYYRLATRFRHYLIDEFQDTSRLQWDNLEAMVEEGLSSGGTLFYVGDKKQAIYRFRGGQRELFDRIRNRFSYLKPATLFLRKNWRSQKEIVEFNNSLFSPQNLAHFLDKSGISAQFDSRSYGEEIINNFTASSQAFRKDFPGGYVYGEKISEANQSDCEKIIEKKVISLIRGLQKRFQLKDLALLTRDNRQAQLLTSWLLKEGIGVESEKTLNVLEHPQVKEIISLLRFLYSPVDDLSFAAFILSDVFAKKTGLAGEARSFLFDLGQSKSKGQGSLYRKFAACFPQTWEKEIAPFLKITGFVSVYELLAVIYRRFRLPANFSGAQAFFKKFLQLCHESQEEEIGLGNFLDYLQEPDPEKLYVDAAAENSVKILTIHKAKGLEFPVVIIPFLKMDIAAETGSRGTKSFLEEDKGGRLRLLRISKDYRKYSPRLRRIYQQSYRQACIDELNNVYVGLTRPKYELYFFLPAKTGNKRNPASFLINENRIEKGSKSRYPSRAGGQKVVAAGKSFYKDWAEYLSEEFSGAGLDIRRKKVKEGIIIHQVLSFIGNCFGINPDECVSAAVSSAGNQSFIDNPGVYKRRVKKIITSARLKEVFFLHRGRVYCEKELVAEAGRTKRIDRMLVKDDSVVIIDYKSHKACEEETYAQLKGYARAAGDIYPGRKIRAEVIYLDSLERKRLV